MRARENDLTWAQHHERWRVSWTVEQNGRSEDSSITHATEVAARKHAGNLVKRRPPGTSIESVYGGE